MVSTQKSMLTNVPDKMCHIKNCMLTSCPHWTKQVEASGILNHWPNTQQKTLLGSVSIIFLNFMITKHHPIDLYES